MTEKEPITDDDQLRDEITALLARFDVGPGNAVGHWVLAYTTSGISSRNWSSSVITALLARFDVGLHNGFIPEEEDEDD